MAVEIQRTAPLSPEPEIKRFIPQPEDIFTPQEAEILHRPSAKNFSASIVEHHWQQPSWWLMKKHH